MISVDVAIIGGGPAGMSAAVSAAQNGAKKVLILEREPSLGGILEQCIHNGFGLHMFKEELSGPEYAERYEDMVKKLNIEYLTETMVTELTPERIITAVNKEKGFFKVKASAVVLAMGCRERTRGALVIPGERPAGVISAGTAQKLVNIKGYMPGKKVVILGSGDIGLIMARRLTLEGAKVVAVCEIMEDSGGLTRNIVQCLNDFNIPLLLKHTVTKIHGKDRVTGVTIAPVDDNRKPITEKEEYVECDTLMLSVGLIPENELSKKAGVKMDEHTKGPVLSPERQTSVKGIFACGNVVKVHELVDYVSEEGELAGKNAAAFALNHDISTAENKGFSHIEQKKGVKNLSQSGDKIVICTTCPMGCSVKVEEIRENGQLKYITSGNKCPRGEIFAKKEMTCPERILTTTMMSTAGIPVPVRSTISIPAERMEEFIKIINEKTLVLPIRLGNIIIENIGGTSADIVAERTFL